MEQLRALVANYPNPLIPHLFCNVGRMASNDVCVYLSDAYISGTQSSLTVDESQLDFNGYGTAYPLYLWGKLHVGYLFELPSNLLHFHRNVLQVCRQRPVDLRLDKDCEVTFTDKFIAILTSKRNGLVTIVPNLPITLKGVLNARA